MEGFKTYKDRLLKATGDKAASLLEEIKGSGATADKYGATYYCQAPVPTTIPTTNSSKKQLPDVTIGGYSLTFLETMQLGSIVLQLVSIIIAIVIACKMKK